jgi:hypothetical protein
MKMRLNIYLKPDLYDRVSDVSAKQLLTKSSIIEAAVASFFSPDAADRREAAFVRRLDRLTRQVERLERDQTIAVETIALFVRFWLSVTPPLPETQQASAKALGTQRYQGFIESLGRRLQRGQSLVREINEEIWPNEPSPNGADAKPDSEEPDHASG